MDDLRSMVRKAIEDAIFPAGCVDLCFKQPDEQVDAAADAVLAALAKAGRLASEVKGDVVEACHDAITNEMDCDDHLGGATTGRILDRIIPIIAADAERRVRAAVLEEAAEKIGPTGPRPCDCVRCDCMNQGDAEAVAAWDERAANAATIRALKESPHA